jgi:hypothetical protein
MRKYLSLLIIIFLSSAYLMSCQKSIDVFVPDPGQTNGADTTWYANIINTMPINILRNTLALQPIQDSIEASASVLATVTLSNGVILNFAAGSCVNSTGTAVTGKVQVELHSIKKKGDMVLMNKPTVSNGNMLVTAGQVFIGLKKNGQEVFLAPNKTFTIRYPDFPTNNAMKLFFGEDLTGGNFNWVQNPDSLSNRLGINQQFYDITTNKLRWINLDYFYDTSGITRSIISIKLPANYTNANTTGFLVFKDIRSVLNINADVNQKLFVSGKIPNGKLAWVVILSRQGNDYFFTRESITTGINTVNGSQNISLTPTKSSLMEIKDWLATL